MGIAPSVVTAQGLVPGWVPSPTGWVFGKNPARRGVQTENGKQMNFLELPENP
jgi:hypothetical protein